MADLTPFADRMEDTEVGANKPLTETLFTKFGKNINFLLDFLGVADGETTPSGSINDLATAISTIEAHTITKQGTFNGGSNVIGTYTPIKFVNRVFWTRREVGNGNGATKAPRALMKQLDGNPRVMFEANPTTPSSVTTFAATPGAIELVTDRVDTTQSSYGLFPSVQYNRFFDGAVGVLGYESAMRDEDWNKIGVLSWRDFNSSAIVSSYHEPVASQMHVYMSYELDVKSAGFYAP